MYKSNIAKTSVKLIIPILIVAVILAVIITAVFSNLQNINKNIDQEIARTMEYQKVEEGDEAIPDMPYVTFDAFFLRDTNGDNEAEPYRGTCREIGSEDTLYMELKVNTNGKLENGKIEINGDKNYYLRTAIVKDDEIKSNVITQDASEILFNEMKNGTQKLLTATVRSGDYTYSSGKMSAIGNNIKKYSKENTIVFTGEHVSDEGVRTKVRKEVKFNVDWHGTTGAQITNIYQTYGVDGILNEEKGELSLDFTVSTQETQETLILKSNVVKGTIPQLSGYSPIRVELKSSNTTLNYDQNTREFTVVREATLDEESGNVSNRLSTSNSYKIKVVYPIEAYKALGTNTVEIRIPVETYYEGYNNANSGYESIHVSNKAEATIVATYRRPQGKEAIFNVYVGEYVYEPYERYMVSKNKPLRIYNGISEAETNDIYTVKWEAYTGTTEKTSGIIMKETENESKQVSDEFIRTDESTVSMEDVTQNIGIYFSSPANMLGEEGWIKVYNDETNELIATFTKENWNKYNAEDAYTYSEPIKHIRVETSEIKANAGISVYNIKELNDNIITQNFAKEEFDKLQYIKTTLVGYVGEERINSDTKNAYYEIPMSIADVSVNKTDLSTQATEKGYRITISTKQGIYQNIIGWTNGTFLLKLPKDILDLEINDVDGNVNITNYEQYELDGEKFIKINVKNEKEDKYIITVDCNITPDPRVETKPITIELYASNEYNKNYYYKAEDIYDVNDNLNVTEQVHHSTKTIQLISPNTLLTSQLIRKYNAEETETVAPRIAILSKEQQTAEIAISLNNNYMNEISRIKIVGKIPSIGNTYTINGDDMGSNFDTTMKESGIKLPEELKQKGVKVYYSTYQDADKDNMDEWTENPNFEEVKSFMIDFQDASMGEQEKYEISYEINIPSGLNYNQVAYSHHAAYFSLQTNSGLYATSVEPNKLGIMIARLYDVELTKYHKGIGKLVPGATYSLQEEGKKESLTKVTNESGKLLIENLYAEKTYILKEIKSPDEYELNENEIKFTTKEEEGNLKLEIISGITKESSITQENGKDKVQIEVEDEVKVKLHITKTEQETGNAIINVRYKITGKGLLNSGETFATNLQGQINYNGLYIGQEYTIEEIKAKGYYLTKPIKLTITSDGHGNYTENINGGTVKQHSISKTDEIPTVHIELENEKIPTYNLKIQKLEKDTTKPIENVKFTLYKGEERLNTYTTDETGIIEIKGLYQYVAEKEVEQTYTLKEVVVPEGYAKVDDITFYASEQEGVLKLTINGGTIKEQSTTEDTITMTIEDEPTFVLIKQDGETKEVLPGVKFAIYDYETGEPATDVNGEIIGKEEMIKGEYYNVVTTNERGKITANLPQGLYKAVELETFEQYELGVEEDRTSYFGIDESKEGVVKYGKLFEEGFSEIDGLQALTCTLTTDGSFIVGGWFSETLNVGNRVLTTSNISDEERISEL